MNMVSPKLKGYDWYKSDSGDKFHLGKSGDNLYCNRSYYGYWSKTEFKKQKKEPTHEYQICKHCKDKAFLDGINLLSNFEVQEDTSAVDMIPEIPVFAIRSGDSMWDIYKNGKKAGEFYGPAEFVEKLIQQN